MKLTSCFSELKTKIDACQGQVKDLTEELGTTRMAFGIYQKDTQAELAELRQHKSILGREVIALRKKLAEEGGNSEKSTTAHHDEKIKSSDQSTKDKNATPISKMEDQAGVQLQQHSMGMTSQIGERASSMGSSSSSSKNTSGPSRSNAKNDKVKRQRTALLRHAARCTVADGDCKVSRHCAEMNQAGVQQHTMGTTSQIGERASSVGSASSSSKSSLGPGSAKNDKATRQRIFLLRHAARCDAADGNCKVSRHCAEMKCVWNHIMNDGCNDPNCNVRHCVSSRYVISHYHRNSKQLLSSRAICGAVKESSRKKEVRHSSHSI
eukprot:CAMPEP_0202031934 /NCGR_PEP_ID=MMETSP0905-20130828/65269_1 /ASSEMBLY_ACC=CAM_ASM_000554 /TAXON_ID=420261 /ORGANISM="Thalassiosira antarctica, Strain CCMP982" /LENGTH=322 /DNA_ID=CAMNT_0048595785 /DNA_START=121 /DNA_END=1089 /DNA_ORIENTATION=-